ncbi:DUF1571 domain-containing protein [Paraburkholderia sp.]|uniref:DUF1571 domain-containing protein n=1 Tax=Paraburkholderia sp. TaxID=1926495 RepID=UPI003C797A4F
MKLSMSARLNRSPAFMHLARFSSASSTWGAPLTASLRVLSSRGLLIGALVASAAALATPPAYAQNDDTPPALDTGVAVKAPTTPSSQVGKLTLDQQVKWLRAAQQSGEMEKLDDAQLVALFQSLDPLALPRYIKEGPNGYPSYEFVMSRSERIHGQWPEKPDHMLVRIAHDPLRIYAKWLPDGAHAGQEIIYDESKRTDEMYGHLGGIMNVMPLWTSLNGALARAQSNHQVRDLGTEYIANQYLSEGRKYIEAGVPHTTQVEVKTIDGVRVVAFTFETPTGQPQFYAKKSTLGLDLRHPYFRTVESYNNDGKIFEKIVFESITPKTFDDSTFDPKNKAYNF